MVTLLAATALYTRQRKETGASPGFVFTFPVAGVLLFCTVLGSVVRTLRDGGVRWRGTLYPLQELRAHAGPLR